MGYRSTIYIQVKNELEEDLLDVFRREDLIDHFHKVNTEEVQTVKYLGDWLKWYDSYSDVKAVNNFIDGNTDSAALLAIGEDGAESARAGSPDIFDMYIVANIEW